MALCEIMYGSIEELPMFSQLFALLLISLAHWIPVLPYTFSRSVDSTYMLYSSKGRVSKGHVLKGHASLAEDGEGDCFQPPSPSLLFGLSFTLYGKPARETLPHRR